MSLCARGNSILSRILDTAVCALLSPPAWRLVRGDNVGAKGQSYLITAIHSHAVAMRNV